MTTLIERQKELGDCYECLKDKKIHPDYPFFIPQMMMIVCLICGNKRCPKATDHNLECTNSNEPNQEGSRYNTNWTG